MISKNNETRKRMTSKEFAMLISNNCAVMGISPSEDEKKMYQDLREQDLKEGLPVIEVDERGFLQKIRDFFFEVGD